MKSVNVTISLSEDLLRVARQLAVDQGLSLSSFLGLLVEDRVTANHRYREARERQRSLLAEGLPLGTNGTTDWDRAALHER